MSSHSNPFLNPELLNPKLTSELDAAFEKNKAKGLVKSSLGAVAMSNLADIVKADTRVAKEQGAHPVLGLDFTDMENSLKNPEKIKQTFETAFTDAEQLFSRIDLTSPTPEQFTEAGVDFLSLATEYERMEKEGLEPAIVINPILRLENSQNAIGPFSHESWWNLYDKLTKDNTIQNNPLRKNYDGNGLWLNSEISKNTEHLFQQEIDLVTKNSNVHYITNQEDNLTWAVALVPNTDKPQEMNTPHTNHEQPNNLNSNQHITISQYLALQASRIQSGQKPLDDHTYTWLQGTFENGSQQASNGEWRSSCGQVYVRCDGINRQRDALGVRLPVLG